MRQKMRQTLCIATLVLTICTSIASIGCSKGQGAPKYPVSGTVLVNGNPAAYMIVRFHAPGQGLVGQDAQPAAVCDNQGRFKLSSFGDNDGAAAADYIVTFYWPTNPITASSDRLQGMFASMESSEYLVSVTPETTELPPFDLELDPEQILPPETISLPDMSP